MAAKTLYDKLWDSHLVQQDADGTGLIYIDIAAIERRHQAFACNKFFHYLAFSAAFSIV